MKKFIVSFLLLLSAVCLADAPKPTALYRDIYPVGWSKNGNFAYFYTYNIGGPCGFCPNIAFKIQSMVTDKVLVEKNWEAFSKNEKDNVMPVSVLWLDKEEEIRSLLKKYGVIKQNSFKTGGKSFWFKGRNYTLNFYPSRRKLKYQAFEAPETTIEMLAGGSLIITSQLGRKAIYKYKRKNMEAVLEMQPVGYILSPYESRIAALLKYTYLDGDGGRAEGIKLIGAHLETRFD